MHSFLLLLTLQTNTSIVNCKWCAPTLTSSSALDLNLTELPSALSQESYFDGWELWQASGAWGRDTFWRGTFIHQWICFTGLRAPVQYCRVFLLKSKHFPWDCSFSMFFLTYWFSDTPTCSTDPAWEWMATRYTNIQNGSPRIEVLSWLHVKWRKHLQLQMVVLICQSNDKRWQLHRWCWVNDRMPSFDLMTVVKRNMATSLCFQHVPGVSSMLHISSRGWIALNTLMKWLDYMHSAYRVYCIPIKRSWHINQTWLNQMNDPSPGIKIRILLSGWHFGAMLLFLRSSRKLEQFAGTHWQIHILYDLNSKR